MDSEIFKFDPKHLAPLLAFMKHRNEAIGIPGLAFGFSKDMFTAYLGYLEDQAHYKNILAFYETHVQEKLARLKDIIEQAKNEPDLTQQKILLINAVELRKELELLSYGES